MADTGVEANVFQIPDLVGAANKQQQQNLLRSQQRDYRSDQFLKGFKKQQGRYLPGHKSVINGLFTDLMSKQDAYKMNPSAANQRAVEQANNLYLDGAAAGQFAFDEVTKQRDFVLQNPSKIAESIPEYNKRIYELSNEEGATIESIQNLIDNPGLYTPKVGQTKKILSPSAYGTKIGQGKIGQRVLAEARAGDGTIDKEKARSIFREQYNLDYGKESNPNGYANHVLYQAGVDGTLDVQIKEDGQVMFDPSIDILGTISSDAFPRERLAGGAYNTGETTFMNTLADMVNIPSSGQSDSQKLKLTSPRKTEVPKKEWFRQRNPYIEDTDKPFPANIKDAKLTTISFKPISDVLGNKIVAMSFEENDGKYYAKKSRRRLGEKVTDEMMSIKNAPSTGGLGVKGTDWNEEDRIKYQKELDKEARESGAYSKEIIYESINEDQNLDLLLTGLGEDIFEDIKMNLNSKYEEDITNENANISNADAILIAEDLINQEG